MKKYAVFTNSKLVPLYELSVSNKIIERENAETVRKIVNSWISNINSYLTIHYKKGQPASIQNFVIKNVLMEDNASLFVLEIVNCPQNIKFRVGIIHYEYETKEVK